MATLDDLRAYGADVDDGMARCMDNEELYLRLVGMAQQDANYDALKAAIDAGDLKAGFEAAHALKGSLSNLSITPLLKPVVEITELLRAETDMDYSELVEAIMSERQRFSAL